MIELPLTPGIALQQLDVLIVIHFHDGHRALPVFFG
jgi:hypothetical protein